MFYVKWFRNSCGTSFCCLLVFRSFFFCLRRRRCRRLRRYYCCCCAAFCRTEKFDWIVEMCQPENGNELTLIRINQTYEWYRKSHAKYRIRPRFILNVYTVYVRAYTHYTPCVWSFSTEKVPTATGNKSIVFTSKRHAKHLCKLTNRGEEKKNDRNLPLDGI